MGSLSIVTDSCGDPRCVIATLSVDVRAFADVDDAFADAYGAWDRLLETWSARC
jgi:uncharacterized protein YhfF